MKKYGHLFSFIYGENYHQFIIDSDNKIITTTEWNNLTKKEFWDDNNWILINHTIIKNEEILSED